MSNFHNSVGICKPPLEEQITKITILQFKQIGESLFSQYQIFENVFPEHWKGLRYA